MANLRREAKGRPCQVRIPGVCSGDPATTVLAHIRMAGITGGGQKAPDQLAAHSCHACHLEIDRQTRNLPSDMARLYHLEGMARTQYALIQEGKL